MYFCLWILSQPGRKRQMSMRHFSPEEVNMFGVVTLSLYILSIQYVMCAGFSPSLLLPFPVRNRYRLLLVSSLACSTAG